MYLYNNLPTNKCQNDFFTTDVVAESGSRRAMVYRMHIAYVEDQKEQTLTLEVPYETVTTGMGVGAISRSTSTSPVFKMQYRPQAS